MDKIQGYGIIIVLLLTSFSLAGTPASATAQ